MAILFDQRSSEKYIVARVSIWSRSSVVHDPAYLTAFHHARSGRGKATRLSSHRSSTRHGRNTDASRIAGQSQPFRIVPGIRPFAPVAMAIVVMATVLGGPGRGLGQTASSWIGTEVMLQPDFEAEGGQSDRRVG